MSDTMSDRIAIEEVKYRYLRALDTRHWDDFADTMTEDVVVDYGSDGHGGRLQYDNRDEVVAYMRKNMGPNVFSEHHVGHPEIEIDGDEATGVWYLQDRVLMPEFDFLLFGAAIYRDRYRRTDAGWKICETGYHRTYEATVSLKGSKLKVKRGPAFAPVDEQAPEPTA